MTELTLLPERSESRLSVMGSQVRSHVSDSSDVARLVGIGLFVLAAGTVLCAFWPHVWNQALPPAVPAVLFLLTLITLLGFGTWFVLFPSHSRTVMTVALTLAPVIWMAMTMTWNESGMVITPVVLVFTGACAAAFFNVRVLILQVALGVGACLVYVAQAAGSATVPMLFSRAAGYVLAVVLFSVGVYLLRVRANKVRLAFQSESQFDVLTGLANRRQVQQMAAGVMASATRQEREVYALVIDVDRMAMVNANHGTGVGDEVIRGVADETRNALRPEDMLARVGGEEFLAAGMVRSQFEAVRIAERLRQAIRRADLPVDVTCSIGVATARPATGVDPAEWMWNLTNVAEESLAAAKASGRDRVNAARQSGDVLGDALEVVTARIGPGTLEVKAPEPRDKLTWIPDAVIARVNAVIALLGVILVPLMFLGQPINTSVRAQSALAIMLAYGCVFLAAALALLARPRWLSRLMPVIIFCADVLWAGSSLVEGASPGYVAALPAVIMGGFAAWLLPPRLLTAQLVITYPLMYVVTRGAGLPQGLALLDALLQATSVVLACLALYLMRRHGEELIARSAELSTIDPTTGLPNRRMLAQRASAIVSGAARQGGPVSVTVLDVDSFWRVNELHGYSGGDKVLAEVARVLHRSTRPEDVLVHLGADHFVIVALGDPDEARQGGERAADAVNAVWAFGTEMHASRGFAVANPHAGAEPMQWLMSQVALAWDDLRSSRAVQLEPTRGRLLNTSGE
ncbi:MAG: diguanylate cyclase [Actinomycetales bacterium]